MTSTIQSSPQDAPPPWFRTLSVDGKQFLVYKDSTDEGQHLLVAMTFSEGEILRKQFPFLSAADRDMMFVELPAGEILAAFELALS